MSVLTISLSAMFMVGAAILVIQVERGNQRAKRELEALIKNKSKK